MKKLLNPISYLFLTAAILLLGCENDGSEPLTLEQQQVKALLGVWAAQSDADVALDGFDAPGDWSDFTITFSEERYSVSGVPSVDANIWVESIYSTSGSGSTSTFQINAGPDQINIEQLTASNLSFSIVLETADDKIGARVEGVSGEWTFNLTKQN